MIRLRELTLLRQSNIDASKEHPDEFKIIKPNLEKLLAKMNILRSAYGKPMIVTSGWRPIDYNRKIGGSKTSCHITGDAVDVKFDIGLLNFIFENPKLIKELGLYIESPTHTKTWLHFQTKKTSKTIFLP